MSWLKLSMWLQKLELIIHKAEYVQNVWAVSASMYITMMAMKNSTFTFKGILHLSSIKYYLPSGLTGC